VKHSLWLQAARILIFIALGASTLASGATRAQNASTPDYVPKIGQQGKDVIWVPTPPALIERMLDMAQVGPNDYVVDLGAGDGRTVIAAAKRGARALGVEYNPDMVALARRNAETAHVSGNAQFIQGDIFETDFSQADVLTLYLLPSLNLRLRPMILKMKPGTRVVSHAFTMADWQPDQTDKVESRTAYMWIVPASIEGTWRLTTSDGTSGNDQLVLRQRFQYADGLVRLNGKAGQLQDFKIQGIKVSFTMLEQTSGEPLRYEFTGRVSDGTMAGVVKLPEGERTWTATRIRPSADR